MRNEVVLPERRGNDGLGVVLEAQPGILLALLGRHEHAWMLRRATDVHAWMRRGRVSKVGDVGMSHWEGTMEALPCTGAAPSVQPCRCMARP